MSDVACASTPCEVEGPPLPSAAVLEIADLLVKVSVMSSVASWLSVRNGEMAGPTLVAIFLLRDAVIELRVSCEQKCSPEWLL